MIDVRYVDLDRCKLDLLTDRVVAENCTSFEDDFATPDTKIYETAD